MTSNTIIFYTNLLPIQKYQIPFRPWNSIAHLLLIDFIHGFLAARKSRFFSGMKKSFFARFGKVHWTGASVCKSQRITRNESKSELINRDAYCWSTARIKSQHHGTQRTHVSLCANAYCKYQHSAQRVRWYTNRYSGWSALSAIGQFAKVWVEKSSGRGPQLKKLWINIQASPAFFLVPC